MFFAALLRTTRWLAGLGLSAGALVFASGCHDTACLHWTREKQTAEAGDAGAGGSSADAGSTGLSCPAPVRAAELLGDPSCAEELVSVDSEGTLNTDAEECCYDVTLKSRSCAAARKEGP